MDESGGLKEVDPENPSTLILTGSPGTGGELHEAYLEDRAVIYDVTGI
ncbi:MAG: hypothetical protein ABEJ93_04200 [Candidatus Nanohalobium sp.]